MFAIGEMVFCMGRLAKVVDIDDLEATLKYIDLDAVVRVTFAPVSSLLSLSEGISPRSLWPEGGQLDAIEELKEQQYAVAQRAERRRLAKKARQSKKIKRQVMP